MRNVERQAHRVALNLHVAFLHDVEQADLNLSGEIGQFIDGEDAAVGARQQSVVHGEFAAAVACPPRAALIGIDVADQIGDGDVGRGQFFDVALFRSEVGDLRLVAVGRRCVSRQRGTMRRVGIVVDFASGDVGRLRDRADRSVRAGCGSLPDRANRAG